jgi:phytanoyl-CoA hydroxylase
MSAPAFEGFVDRIEDGWILGWAWQPASPNTPIEIDVVVDGVVACTGRAALYRPDLEKSGKGNGQHAFELRLPEELKDGQRHQLRIVAAGSTATIVAHEGTVTFGAKADASPSSVVQHANGYRSPLGGLWTDLSNALEIVKGKAALGWISAEEAAQLTQWIANGFVIIPQAVPHEAIDRLDREIDQVWSGTSSERYFVEFWENGEKTIQPAGPSFKDRRVKLLDVIAHSQTAREIVFAAPIVRFLSLVFERPVLAFQSLYFRWGSQQDIHQDTAFVKVSSPLELAASWVALEDIQPNSGELEYYVGSHRLEDYLFDGAHKWMPFRSDEYDAFVASLHQRSEARGLERQRFLPKKGDALIWSADLAHGGRKNAEGVTRKSLVTHYCPASCEPVYAVPGVTYPRHRFDAISSYTVAARD